MFAENGPQVAHQKRRDESTDGVGDEIIPAGIAAGQHGLVPLIERANAQRTCGCQEHHACIADAERDAANRAQACKYRNMGELIPRRWNQIDSERLGAADENGHQSRTQREPRERAPVT